MKKRILAFVVCVAATALAMLTPGTFAWFTDANVNQQIFEIGDLIYVYSGNIVPGGESQRFVPGESLLTTGNTLSLTNLSTIDSNLRIRIVYSYVNPVTGDKYEDVIYEPGSSLDSYMSLELSDKWLFDPSDDCYHFRYGAAGTGNEFVLPKRSSPVGYSFEIIQKITFDGDSITNMFSGTKFSLKIVFQAKQRDHVDWLTIGQDEIVSLLSPP